jgi:hypothetical protein
LYVTYYLMQTPKPLFKELEQIIPSASPVELRAISKSVREDRQSYDVFEMNQLLILISLRVLEFKKIDKDTDLLRVAFKVEEHGVGS